MAGFVKGDVQITSQQTHDRYAISLADTDFASGGLKQTSNVRPNRVFTADRALVLYRAGSLKPEKIREVIDRLVAILEE